jgi:DNA-binding beta-propeller fold protein YncE
VRAARRLLLPLGATLVVAAAAWAGTGGLTAKGCFAEPTHNPAGCTKTAKGLDNPHEITVSGDGKSLYVAGFDDSAIVRFDRSKANGSLDSKGCVADQVNNPAGCTQTAQGLYAVQQVAVSSDGKSAYAVGYADNALVRFKRNTTTGALQDKGCIADPDHNFAGCTQTAQGLDGAHGVAVSADGKSVYVAGVSDNAIVRFKRNTTNGALQAKGCVADPEHNSAGCGQTADGLDTPETIVVSGDGKSVYSIDAVDNAVVNFDRNKTTGHLTPKGCVAEKGSNPDGCGQTAKGLNTTAALALSRDGESLYVAGLLDNSIVRFNRNTKTGAIHSKGCIADKGNNPAGCAKTTKGLAFVISLAVSADGRSVYATGEEDNAVVRFKRDRDNGALASKGCIAAAGNNPDGCPETAKGLETPLAVAVPDDGKSVYVSAAFDDALARFDRKP